jgi:DNA helicase-2/ATP-dependent DNA helicase PcrA
MDFLEGLNPQQREAVAHADGPLLILAGAGSGKTRVITHRIAHLMSAHSVPGWSILAVTFTNKAANEMRERVVKLLGSAPAGEPPLVSTFHSFCVRLLRRDGARLADIRPGFTPRFTIYDEDEQLALVKQVYRALGLEEKQFINFRGALARISHAKNRKEVPNDIRRRLQDPTADTLAEVYERYELLLHQNNALDFDDLLLESVRLLEHDHASRDYWNRRIRHLLIDEFQDTNRSQYELMRLFTRAHQNVCVVGDEDQSIYSWRGADIRNILDFEEDYPQASVIRLEQNYRSTKTILDAASAVVARNAERKGKWLWTEGETGDPIGLYEASDSENEALWIADIIDRTLRQAPEQRVAVLYRTNAQSRQIEEALRRYRRRYLVIGGLSFYQRAEVKDILAYLKAAISPYDSISLLRIINTPARGIGRTTIEQMETWVLKHNLSFWNAIPEMLANDLFPRRAAAALGEFRKLIDQLRESVTSKRLHEALTDIIDLTGYGRMLQTEGTPEAEGRLDNLKELVSASADAVARGEDAAAFLDHAALIAETDQLNETAQVLLLTAHNAKGLEFPNVFIAGLEEGLFPHIRSLESRSAMEEERRLFYVAMTRAQKRLVLTYARRRRRYAAGNFENTIPSAFLSEVPSHLVHDFNRRSHAGVDLFLERHEVRESARRNTFTGKTYNSLENISQFFSERGIQVPAPKPKVLTPPKPVPKGLRPGATVQHPTFGRGTLLRKEGDGPDARLTVNFPGYGLRKLVAKYAGITVDE